MVIDFKKIAKNKYGFNNLLILINPLLKIIWLIPYIIKFLVADIAIAYYKGLFRILKLPEKVINNYSL